MERQHAPAPPYALMPTAGPQLSGPNRDRDVVKMAEVILVHFPEVSRETAFALLKSASKRFSELRAKPMGKFRTGVDD